MQLLKIKGHEYKINPTRDSFVRRLTQYKNGIRETFRKIGLTENDVDFNEDHPIKNTPANVTWWVEDHYCHFSFNKMNKHVDNMLVISKVIENAVKDLLDEKMSIEEFVTEFKEDKKVAERRLDARKFFELEDNHVDLKIINEKYKKLAKTLHPDMPNGSEDKFKELNEHHKTLKRELE